MANTVLVVEDEQILAQNLKAFLEAKGLDVRVAHDGAKAISLAEGFAAEVVVLDFRLPDMEGFQVLEAVRPNRKCHFVLMTAHPSDQVFERASQLGIGHILLKPFPLVELARVVCDLVGLKFEGTAGQHGEGFVERRQSRTESFPLQLFDGSWVLAERRMGNSAAPVPDTPQQANGE
ncbi:Transcriptional regulatory protein YycF [compost metagenome]